MKQNIKVYPLFILFIFCNILSYAQNNPKGVIFIMTDDQGYGDIDALYPSSLNTPALDELSRESVMLTDFHSGTTCAPSRAALMTGRDINASGVWHTIAGREVMRENEQTIAELFQANGWNTGIFGKWHLGDGYPFSPRFRGFDKTVIHGAGGVNQGPDYWGNDYYSGIDRNGNPTASDFYFEDGVPVESDRFVTDYFFHRTQEFIQESVNKNEPFFCYLPTNAPHSPFNAPFGGKSGFDGLVENIDDNMAALDDYLEQLGIKDDVLLVFTTDNGTVSRTRFGGLRDKKGSPYDGGHNVPCFVRWKNGGIAGTVQTARAESSLTGVMDFFPTFMEMFNLQKPAGGRPLTGNNLTNRLLNANTTTPNRTLIVDTQRQDNLQKWKNAAVMRDEVQNGTIIHKWRMIRRTNTSPFELYDFMVDRDQSNNIAANHPDIIQSMIASYEVWYASISQNAAAYSPFVVDDDFEEEQVLHAHSWIKGGAALTPFGQGSIKNAVTGSGISAIRFDKAGRYVFELRRWPREDGGAIIGKSNSNEGTAITATTQARVSIAGVGQETVSVQNGAAAALIEMDVPSGGVTEITAEFLNSAGNRTRGAYYVYIRRAVDVANAPVIAYANCNFTGAAFPFQEEGSYFWGDGDFDNDVIGSLKIAEGYEVTAYENKFSGNSEIYRAAEADCLAGTIMNDEISSLIINKVGERVSFVPDPNKLYYIDVPQHNLRLGATGASQDAFTTSTNTTGANVEWNFVAKGNGYWHLQRAAGGSASRLRTDNSEFADMQGTGNSGVYTYYTFNAGASTNTHYLTLPDGPADHQRLQIAADGIVRFVPTVNQGTSVSFRITEVPSGQATLYRHCGYNGDKVTLGIGEYPTMPSVGLLNNDISSLRVPVGLQVTLFNKTNFGGSSLTFTADDNCLINNSFNDMTSSFIIEPLGANTRSSDRALSVTPEFGQKSNLQWYYLQEESKKVKEYVIRYSTSEEVEMLDLEVIPAEAIDGMIKYEYLHHTPVVGVNYYQVIVQFEDGTANYQMTGELSFEEQLGAIQIAPNPTDGNLFINLEKYMDTSVDYFVSTIDGNQLLTGTWNSAHGDVVELNLDKLQNGLYIIYMKPKGYRAVATKFVVSKDY